MLLASLSNECSLILELSVVSCLINNGSCKNDSTNVFHGFNVNVRKKIRYRAIVKKMKLRNVSSRVPTKL